MAGAMEEAAGKAQAMTKPADGITGVTKSLEDVQDPEATATGRAMDGATVAMGMVDEPINHTIRTTIIPAVTAVTATRLRTTIIRVDTTSARPVLEAMGPTEITHLETKAPTECPDLGNPFLT